MHKKILIFIFLFSFIQAKTFTVSYDPDYAPFSYSAEGKPYGLFIDIWTLWGKKNSYDIKFTKAKNWDDAIQLAKTGKVDFFLGTTPYEAWMKSSLPYYVTSTSLFALKTFTNTIHTVGIIGEDYKTDLEKKFDHIKIVSFDNYSDLIDALITQKVDAIYDDTIAISYFAIKNRYTHLIKKLHLFSSNSEVKAISSDKRKIDLFNRGFKRLTLQELSAIEKNWIEYETDRYFSRSASRTQQLTYVFDPDWRPFEWKDEMRRAHMGIIADILSLISTKTGIDFKPVHTENWNESTQLVKEGKAEMFSAVPYTKARAEYLNFTKHSIYSYPAVLVSHVDHPLTLDEDYNGKSIGIIKGNSLGEWIKQQYPNARFIEFENIKSGFKAIEDKTVDFFGVNGITALYYINILGFDEAKIYTKMKYMFHLKIALRKEVSTKILNTIDMALANISQKELSDIYHKWTAIKVQKELNWRLLLIIFAIVAVIVLTFLLINHKLKKLVAKKTFELQELNDNLEQKVKQRTEELAQINKHMQDSIAYASLIQNSILPFQEEMQRCFREYFIIWEPKDIVGGDIYFFNEVGPDKYLLFVIDCTGHGVSGAFVTMLVKAIQEQLILEAKEKIDSPALILEYFNRSLKKLLKQETSHSNVGLDAGIVLIDRTNRILKYAGANIPLYYTENGNIHTIKANRYSIGYRQCQTDYRYRESQITFTETMHFYLGTDGYIDQNGGEKGFPFGKRRFKDLLLKCYRKPFTEQKELFIDTLARYQQKEERNDDITMIGFKL